MAHTVTDTSRRTDRLAELLIRIGGLLVIVSVIGILVMITRVALPLFARPSATITGTISLPTTVTGKKILAIGSEETGHGAIILDNSGTFHFLKTSDSSLTASIACPVIPAGAGQVVAAEATGKSTYHLHWNNGAISAVTVELSATKGDDGSWNLAPAVSAREDVAFAATPDAAVSYARVIEGKGALRVDLTTAGQLRVVHQLVEKDLLGNEKKSCHETIVSEALPGRVSALAVDSKGHYLYAGTANGWLLRFDISEPGQARLLDSVSASESRQAITSLALVQGDVSVAVGDAAGSLSTWFPVKVSGSGEDRRLTRIHTLRSAKGPVTLIIPTPRDKTVFSAAGSELHADHMTSERHLLSLQSPAAATLAALSPKGTALVALSGSSLTLWKLSIPHPEISFGTLFGKVWYEGYDQPEFAWQSSAANDDFEPKLSLVPLVFGTIKATLCAMLFATPLALLAALYTSQFMAPKLKGRVKPVVEIMAAIPSVVIGFLGGLWLAPLLDKSILTLVFSVLLVPLLLIITMLFWKQLKTASPLQRLLKGREFIVVLPVVVLGVYLASLTSGSVEAQLCGGDFKQWLFSSLGIRYDQRNSIIIAIALGFAVVPIIFTIAEDALSNVPRNLTAASLALGASRWQTAWRVVLPSALPGVFSAIMIGFGRAIGETMIVLMATGNTPIMSWSLFNGLRSLSANIAVEIPEAPLNSSLYRTLFLSAVLLFIFTFIINTVAEALRQKFRKKYGRY